MPTKNGEIMAARAVEPYANPTCSPEKWSVAESQVPIVTDHAPHTKYCRNIIVESFRRVLRVTTFLRVALFALTTWASIVLLADEFVQADGFPLRMMFHLELFRPRSSKDVRILDRELIGDRIGIQ